MSASDARPTSAVLHEFCAALFAALLQELHMPFNPSAKDSTYSYATTRIDPGTLASSQRWPEATAPCPACGSTRPRAGFCCDSCHTSYMTEQHRRWNMPATGREDQDWPACGGWRQPEQDVKPRRPLPYRPDPCWHTDEQVGSWSRCVRALEEAAA